MRILRVINRRFAKRGAGGSVAGAVNVVAAANVDEAGPSSTRVSSRQRIVQRGGRTVVVSEERTSEEGSR